MRTSDRRALSPLRVGITAAQAIAATVAIARISRGARRLPPLHPITSIPGPPPSVSVVIPARDEAERIGPCLQALRIDPQVSEIIVVDDESTDATADVARSLGATVVTGAALPRGWVGKPWALHQGLRAATGEWVLTLDADVVPKPGLIGALVGAAAGHGWDLVSAGPRFICRAPAQRLLHASMLATLVYRFGPAGPPRAPAPRRAMANGQCLMVRRSWLLDQGGFAAVGGHMTDDIALVRWLAESGASIGFTDGAEVVEVEMHRSLAEVWREWGRSLPMPDVTHPADQAADLALVWLVMALPVLRLLGGRPTRLDLGLLAIRLGMVAALRGAYTEQGPPVWASWLADPATAVRLTQGALRPTRRWRGRTYAA
ncbi:MAG: glycosyltransferase family 2 protein [Acidimicrobiales bacterium]